MELEESIECVSRSGGVEEDAIHSHHHKSSLKHHQNGVVSSVLRSMTNVQELLKCAVCFDFMYSPIYQCPNGHTLCSRCKPRVLNKCPSCRQQLGDIRCLALEKMAESLELHCKYEEFGCPEIILYHTKFIHEELCNFRPYNCLWSGWGCSVVGDIPSLVSHLTDYHKAGMMNGCEFKLRFVIANLHEEERCIWMVNVLIYCGQYFCLHVEAVFIRSAPVYIAFICFMGNEADACNYRYRLEIEGNGRKFIFEGIPGSIRESQRKIMESGDGLIVMRSMLQSLRNLEVTGRIWKNQSLVCTCMDKSG